MVTEQYSCNQVPKSSRQIVGLMQSSPIPYQVGRQLIDQQIDCSQTVGQRYGLRQKLCHAAGATDPNLFY